MKPKTETFKWMLILAPGEVDRDWRIYQAKQLRKQIWKGFYIGCIAMAALVVIGSWMGNLWK